MNPKTINIVEDCIASVRKKYVERKVKGGN